MGKSGKSETQPISRPAPASEGKEPVSATIVFDLPIQLGLGIQGVIRLPKSAIETVKQLKTLLVSDDASKGEGGG